MPVLRVAKNIRNALSSMLIMVMVAACGGSGPAGVDTGTGGTGGTGGDSANTNTISLSWADGGLENVVQDNAPRTLNIQLNDSSGVGVPNEIVSVSTSLGSLFPSSGNVSTNNNGLATIQVDVAGTEDGEAGAINVVQTNATGSSTSSRLTFSAAIVENSDPTTIAYVLESGFFSTSVLTSGSGVAAIQNYPLDGSQSSSISDYAAALTSADRDDDIGASVNAVQSSIYAVRLTKSESVLGIEGVVIDFSTSVGSIVPSSGKALTNKNGVAYVIVNANNEDPGSAGSITATIGNASKTDTFAVGEVSLKIGFTNAEFNDEEIGILPVTTASNTLTVDGTATLTVNVVKSDAVNTPFNSAQLNINFESECSKSGLATIDTSVPTDKEGKAVATYQLSGCSLEVDVVTATIEGLSGLLASSEIFLPTAAPKSIQFVSADPLNIALKGTGGAGRQEFSDVVFKVVDEAGLPVVGAEVEILLSTDLGGITLTGDASGDGLIGSEVLTSNSNGEVRAKVNAGNISTGVRLIATEVTEKISTTSDQLVISTGLPDQDSMSLSATTLSPGGDDYDGIQSTINIRAADAFNNPVPEGTVVYFTTEYGKIEDFCTMPAIDSTLGNDVNESGVCSVIWSSQNPRSADYDYSLYLSDNGTRVGKVTGDPADGTSCSSAESSIPCIQRIGNVFGGHTTILAYALGEETFVDADGDGLFGYLADDVTTEVFTDLPEVFIDHNGDGVFGNEGTPGACVDNTDANPDTSENECANWQPGGEFEEFVDADSDGIYDWANGIYNGSLCSPEAAANDDCDTQLVYVSDSLEINAGGSVPLIGIYDESGNYLSNPSVTLATATDTAVRQFVISDEFNGRLPAGTTVTISTDNCKLSGLTSFEVSDTNAKGNLRYFAYLSEDTETDNKTGFVSITVTVPVVFSGGVREVIGTSQFACNDDQ